MAAAAAAAAVLGFWEDRREGNPGLSAEVGDLGSGKACLAASRAEGVGG